MSHLKSLFILGCDPDDVALAIVLMEIRAGKKYKELNDEVITDLALIYAYILEELWIFFGVDSSDDPKIWAQKYNEIRKNISNKETACA